MAVRGTAVLKNDFGSRPARPMMYLVTGQGAHSGCGPCRVRGYPKRVPFLFVGALLWAGRIWIVPNGLRPGGEFVVARGFGNAVLTNLVQQSLVADLQ